MIGYSKVTVIVLIPANTRHWPNVVSMLGRRRRRRANIKTILGKCLVFAEIALKWSIYQQWQLPGNKTSHLILQCAL